MNTTLTNLEAIAFKDINDKIYSALISKVKVRPNEDEGLNFHNNSSHIFKHDDKVIELYKGNIRGYLCYQIWSKPNEGWDTVISNVYARLPELSARDMIEAQYLCTVTEPQPIAHFIDYSNYGMHDGYNPSICVLKHIYRNGSPSKIVKSGISLEFDLNDDDLYVENLIPPIKDNFLYVKDARLKTILNVFKSIYDTLLIQDWTWEEIK